MKTKHLAHDRIKNVGQLPKIDHKHIVAALGDDTPEGIDATRLGEHRLHQAMHHKFGENYKTHPKAQMAIAHYEHQQNYVRKLAKLRLGMK